MKYRLLGKTNTKISEVGLGTWQLGNADWGVLDEQSALRILRHAYDNGITFFDTADVYGLGTSERLIGKFIKEIGKDKIKVATKLCRVEWATAGRKWPSKYTLAMTRRACERSCKNLGVDSLFLQQWHCPPTEWFRSGEIFEHVETLRKEGLIQYWGASVESVEEGLLCMTHPHCATLQVIFNIFRQKVVTDLLPVAKRCNVGIIARVPLASGLLTGKFKKGHKFDPKDHRNYNKNGEFFNVGETFAGIPFEKGVAFSEKIKKILKPTEKNSMAQLALRWILDHEEISTVIPGATKTEQVDSNAGASDIQPLPQKIHAALEKLYNEEIKSTIRGPY